MKIRKLEYLDLFDYLASWSRMKLIILFYYSMPSKRSKSKEKEHKRRAREKRTEEEVSRDRAKARNGMKIFRKKSDDFGSKGNEKISQGDNDWYEKVMARSRICLREKRRRQSNEEKERERCGTKLRMRKLRDERSKEKKEYDKLYNKHRKRKIREQRSDKKKDQDNLHAKDGMKLLRNEGRIYDFKKRGRRNQNEEWDWKEYFKKGSSYEKILQDKKPDIIEKLNDEIRKEKEKERIRKEREKKREEEGEWLYHGESGEWYWTGREDQKYEDAFCYSAPTEEEKKLAKEQEKREFEWWVAEREKERKERRRQKNKEMKDKMKLPIPPIPDRQLCPYEQLREDNIKEREDAMKKCGFFDDLKDTKKEIGFPLDDIVKSNDKSKNVGLVPSKTISNKTRPNKNLKKVKQTKELKNEESKYNLKNKTKKFENIGKQNSSVPIGEKSEDENVKSLSVTKPVEIDEWYLHDCLE